MLPTAKTLFRKYFDANRYEAGFVELTDQLPASEASWSDADRNRALTALQLSVICHSPAKLKAAYKRYEPGIKAGKPEMGFETELILARLTYHRGYYLRTYRILDKLDDKVRAFFAEKKETLGEAFPTSQKARLYFLLVRIHDLAGKALHRMSDHTLARLHTTLAHVYLEDYEANSSEKNGSYMRGKLLTILARSFFDYPHFSVAPEGGATASKILKLLSKAEAAYDAYFGNDGQRNNLFYSEIHELRALYFIRVREEPVPDAQDWFRKANDELDAAYAIIDQALEDKTHRRFAHILRYRALAYLRHGQQEQRQPGADATAGLEQLTEAKRLYLEEYRLRQDFFGDVPHPTIVRNQNYLSRAYIHLAEIAHQLGKPREHQEYVRLTQACFEEARKRNLKAPEDRAIDQRMARDLAVPEGKFSDRINDYQVFRTLGRQLQLLNLQYRTAPNQRQAIYEEVVRVYDECFTAREETMSWLTWEESRQTIIDEFCTMQEAALEVYHLHHEKHTSSATLKRTIENKMLIVHLHGNRDDDYATRHNEYDKVRTYDEVQRHRHAKMQQLQEATLERIGLAPATPTTSIDNDCFKELSQQLLRQGAREIKKRKDHLANKQDRDKRNGNAEVISVEGIFRELNGEGRGCVISVFGAKRFLFALCLFKLSETSNEGEVRSIALGGIDQPYLYAKRIKQASFRLQDAIAAFHHKVHSWRHEPREVSSQKFAELLCSNECRLDAPQRDCLPDKLNTELLSASYDLYRLLIAPLDLPRCRADRVYLTFNKGHLQRTPLNLLCLEDPRVVFSTEAYRPFNSMSFLGTEYQNAMIPSLQALWRLRNEQDEGPAPDSPPDDGHPIKFLGVFGTQNNTFNDMSISQRGTLTRDILAENIFPYRNLKPTEYEFFPALKSYDRHDTTSKAKILIQGKSARVLHFYCHVSYDQSGRFGVRKMILDEKEIKGASPERIEINAREVSVLNYAYCYLVFVNGCGSADGPTRPGDIPNSMMAAFLEGGARGAIGTHYPTYIKQAGDFAEHFYNHLFNDSENEEYSIGRSLQETIKLLLRDPEYADTAHPLHWGSYIFMGDTTVRLSSISDFRSGETISST